MKRMKAKRIFETVLYADDLGAARRFYEEVLGLELYRESELMLVFRLADSVLLIFDPDASEQSGRDIPRHGTRGSGHVAFGCSEAEIQQWDARLQEMGVVIEHRHPWPDGGISLYARDPAGNSVEFAPPTLWGGGWSY